MPASKSKLVSHSTIKDVAAQAGVSKATVSRVINQTGPVATETAERVWAAITALDFTPSTAARGLATRKTNTLGIILPNIGNYFLAALFKGLARAADNFGYTLLMYSTQTRNVRKNRIELTLPVGEHNSDGLIIFADSLDPAEVLRLHKRQFPLVLLHRTPPDGTNIPTIGFENKKGARELVEHLITVHHYRRIAFLSGYADDEDSQWRELGYREALAAHNIPFDPTLIGVGGFSERVAKETVALWLAEGKQFDAIFAADDESAVGAMKALEEAGRQIPNDVALVGFDDIALSRYLNPPLTTVRAPIEEVGKTAVEQLMQLIQTGHATPLVLLPVELIIRNSCGC